jgi:NADH:ubiquinone oxidoreductase subunit 4 (subunit M)
MLGQTNQMPFADLTFHEGLLLVIIAGVLFFFGVYPKPITDLLTPALDQILTQINRFN